MLSAHFKRPSRRTKQSFMPRRISWQPQVVRDAKFYFVSLTNGFWATPFSSMSCDSLLSVEKRGRQKSWKQKVHPAFLEIVRIYRNSQETLSGSDPHQIARNAQKLRAQVSQTREDLLKRYPKLRPGSRDNLTGILEWLCWRRYGQPLAILVVEDKAGNLEAHNKVRRLRDDLWHLVHGRSPIEPFKGNSHHSEIMELGLSLGLDALTDEELADCFDEFCACGKAHDADALKKQRARVRKSLQAAHDQRLRAIPSRERFAVYGAHGLTAKAYHWAAKGIRHVEVSQHGKQPECLIYPDGTAVAVENSQFWGIEGLDRMLEALGVESPEQLFSMFFPT
jgi:hypothetical protein